MAKKSRRRFLASAASIGGIIVGSLPVQGSQSIEDSSSQNRLPNRTEIRERLADTYGERAAAIAVNVIEIEYARYTSDDNITATEFISSIESRLERYPSTQPIVENRNQTLSQLNTVRQQGIEQLSTQSVSVSSGEVTRDSSPEESEISVQTHSGDEDDHFRPLFEYRTATNSTSLSYSGASLYEPCSACYLEMSIDAHAFVYGSAWAEIEQYTTYTPQVSGTHEIGVPYNTDGRIAGGSAELYIYKRPRTQTEGIVPSIDSRPTQEGEAYVEFDLNEGEEYEIGVQAIVSADGTAGESYANFARSNDQYISTPGIYTIGPNGLP